MNVVFSPYHPYILIIFRFMLAAVFLFSAFGKLKDLSAFVSIVLNYQILPANWARRFATLLPLLEVAIGLMLLFGAGTKLAALISGLLLISFLAAISINLLRGRTDLNCGCTGGRNTHKVNGSLLLRNIVLLLMTFYVLLEGQDSLTTQTMLSSISSLLVRHIFSVGSGLPFALSVFGSLLFLLLMQQLRQFAHVEDYL